MAILKGTPSAPEIHRHATDKLMRALSVALPGTVVSYDHNARTATVRPGVHKLVPSLANEDEDVVRALPAVQDVPVCWPAGRGFAFADVDLEPGDPVLLICMDRDASVWRRTGQPGRPEDTRMHHWGSCVAIPGLVPRHNPLPEPNDSAALASKVNQILDALKEAPSGDGYGAAVKASLSALTTVASSVLKLDH